MATRRSSSAPQEVETITAADVVGGDRVKAVADAQWMEVNKDSVTSDGDIVRWTFRYPDSTRDESWSGYRNVELQRLKQ